MKTSAVTQNFVKKIAKLKRPISDDQQKRLNELIDTDINKRLNMDPRDPRAQPYLKGALWLWR